MKKVCLYFLMLITSGFSYAQDAPSITHKKLEIHRIQKAPKIDGVLNDDAWKNASIAGNFVMFRPDIGKPEPQNQKTIVKMAYDDEAIYVAAYLYDDNPQEIPREFQTRDNFGNADFFGVVLNPANDGINQTEFFVTSAGNQNDAKVTAGGREDFSWNAVWNSAVKIVADGWIVEIKIPYSALRFNNEAIQTWGVNFHRRFQSSRDQYSWNLIDLEKGEISQFDGLLTGIENIKPPTRLSFNPFVFGSATTFDGEEEYDWSAGMDVKYGINENFTLDATLVPDFGQVAFDDVVLNLGPFEQRYSEQRSFFTEGTDLFQKGNLFFSRRIGSAPIGYANLNANEEEIDRPNKVDALNIIKISGRTQKGLGIGFLNAITKKTEVDIKKTEVVGGVEQISYRKEVIEPLTNYNVFVLDQQFNKNSSVSLVNTNVTRNGSFRDANVTALLFDIKTKNNKYGVNGKLAMSNVYQGNGAKPNTGLEGDFGIGKEKGKHQYGTGFDFVTKKYNKNDLGFQRGSNEMGIYAHYSYRIYKPKGNFNNMNFNFWSNAQYLMTLDKSLPSYQEKSSLYTGNHLGFNAFFSTKKQLSFGANIGTSIGQQYDYYEPRAAGRFYKTNPGSSFNAWFSTNYSKKFALDGGIYKSFRWNEKRQFYSFNLAPRYRLNNRVTFIYRFNYGLGTNAKFYVTQNSGNIIFGNRKTKRITNTISTKYNFNTKAALALSFRHYWSPVSYDDQYYTLQLNGTLQENTYSGNHDVNFNTWNIDLNFNWEFAPGSQLIALYRNSIFNRDNMAQLGFGDNLSNLFDQPISHNLSLKLVYYIDYNNISHLFKKTNG